MSWRARLARTAERTTEYVRRRQSLYAWRIDHESYSCPQSTPVLADPKYTALGLPDGVAFLPPGKAVHQADRRRDDDRRAGDPRQARQRRVDQLWRGVVPAHHGCCGRLYRRRLGRRREYYRPV